MKLKKSNFPPLTLKFLKNAASVLCRQLVNDLIGSDTSSCSSPVQVMLLSARDPFLAIDESARKRLTFTSRVRS